MNTEDYIIVNKKELEKELDSLEAIRNSGYIIKGLNYDKHYIDAKIYCIESIFSKSKPFTSLLEEAFEESRLMIFENEPVELEHLCDEAYYKHRHFEDFIKDKEL